MKKQLDEQKEGERYGSKREREREGEEDRYKATHR